jgi:oxygen-dependent protoporphyrinogen oxidase
MERAAKRLAEHGAPEPIFTTLRTGLSTLIDRMAATLPEGSIRLGCAVMRLGQDARGGWRVETGSNAGEWFDEVILATPADVTRELLGPLDAEAAALLAMEATSAIVVALAYEPERAAGLRIPRGFGFLVPPGEALDEEPRLLAGTFMDQKFASRAPAGGVFLRGFFGGLAAPRMLDWPDEAIAEAARAQFSRLLGPLPAASHTVVRRWPRSLPQYAVGHVGRMRALADRIDRMRGLGLVGNAYQGVGLPNLVEHGRSAARAVVSNLEAQPQST